jgi:ElaB/YqjD/DUF883 family membrane-anchored ribosome-binding protein
MAHAQNRSSDQDVDKAVRAARAMGSAAPTVTDNFQHAMDRSVRDQPLTTLGLAVMVGFVLGAIWKA